MHVNILGTEYKILLKKHSDDEAFERNSIDGYCNGFTKEIVVCDLTTKESWQHETALSIREAQKLILRHEIVHAFFNESGLQDSSFVYDGAWAKCEEMVDWLAIQGEKLYKAWQEAENVFFAPVISVDEKEMAKAVSEHFEQNTKRALAQRFT